MLSLWGSKRAINAELDLSRWNQVQLLRHRAVFVPPGRILSLDQNFARAVLQEQDPRKEIRSALSVLKALFLLLANAFSDLASIDAKRVKPPNNLKLKDSRSAVRRLHSGRKGDGGSTGRGSHTCSLHRMIWRSVHCWRSSIRCPSGSVKTARRPHSESLGGESASPSS